MLVEVLGHAMQLDLVCGCNFPVRPGDGEKQAGLRFAGFFSNWKSNLSPLGARLQR